MDSKLMLITDDYEGLHIRGNFPECTRIKTIDGKTRTFEVSKDGRYLVRSDNLTVTLVDMNTLQEVLRLDAPGAQLLRISPMNRVLTFWTVSKQDSGHNVMLYEIPSGKFLQSFKQKQSFWCLDWTDDEAMSARFFNGELHFYENNDYSRYVNRLYTQKVADFSVSTCKKGSQVIYYVAIMCLGAHGQPNFVKLFRYPDFNTPVSQRSFFNATQCEFKWSPRGDSVLVICSSEVDNTGKSYYGKQSLIYMDTNTSSSVSLDKEGSVHTVEWHPSTKNPIFAVIYGFFPPKVTLFNSKCQIAHDFGEIQANQIFFNRPYGNLLALAGFGNLRSGIFIYNFEKKSMISRIQCCDTTQVSWAPDGLHLLTAITAPRMRIGNCFQVWHYSGKMLHEEKYPDGDSLLRALWRPCTDFPAEAPKIIESNVLIKTQDKGAKPTRYVPPALRKGAALEKPASKPSPQSNVSDRDKKMKSIEKKLDAIKKLKKTQKAGGHLEKNQLEKISKEKELLKELEDLKISA